MLKQAPGTHNYVLNRYRQPFRWGVKRPGREPNHSRLGHKNTRSYSSITAADFVAWYLIKQTRFTFTYQLHPLVVTN
jgi:hypothetical protein